MMLTSGDKAPNLQRFSARQDGFPAAVVGIARGGVAHRFVTPLEGMVL
jgi:hypothetical protein